MGVRRCSGQLVAEVFRRLWKDYRDDLIDTELQLVAASESWSLFPTACLVSEKARSLIKQKKVSDAGQLVFKFLKELTLRDTDKSAYALTNLVLDDQPSIEAMETWPALRKTQFKHMQDLVRFCRTETKNASRHLLSIGRTSMVCKGKQMTYVESVIALLNVCATDFRDQIILLAAGVLAATERKLDSPQYSSGIGPRVWVPRGSLPWAIISSLSLVGSMGVAQIYRQMTEDIPKSLIDSSWRYFYTDRDVHSVDVFWNMVSNKYLKTHGSIGADQWWGLMVKLRAFCEDWIRREL
jgi:hypothetical protein